MSDEEPPHRGRRDTGSAGLPGALDDDAHPQDVHPDDRHPEDVHPEDLPPEEGGPGAADDWYDEGLADHVMEPEEPEADGALGGSARPRRRRRSPIVRALTYLVALAVVVAAGVIGWRVASPLIPELDFSSNEAADYEGEGTGEVSIDVPVGAGGGEIGIILQEADVVASGRLFSDLTAANPAAQGIQPGTYLMREQMSAAAALDRMLDPEALQAERVTIPEGLWASETYARLAEATENDVADYEAVDPGTDLELPEAAQGRVEGYLYPQTYTFAVDATPAEQLQAMIDQGDRVRTELGIAADDADTVIIASLIQSEGRLDEDLPRISRVIQNRLEDEQALQFDSTVHYIEQARGRAGTSDEARAQDDPYNTYVNEGLPPGPISNPGRDSLVAAQEPADGEWRYFVTVDPGTGETLFADDFEAHEENVAIFQQWCRDNPDQC